MSQPNTRFDQYTQIIKNNEVVGFKLDNNEFEFLFDKFGGWFDEEGKYYNADAIQCDPPEESSDQESQPQQKVLKQQIKLTDDLMKLNVKQDNNRVEVIRQLTDILESYPQGKCINIFLSLQPSQQNQTTLIEQYVSKKLNQNLKIDEDGLVEELLSQQLALSIIELQGTKIQSLANKPTIYVDVELYDSLDVSFKKSKKELQQIFNELNYEKNIDYANMQQQEYETGKYKTYVEIKRDIEQELLDENLQFEVQKLCIM